MQALSPEYTYHNSIASHTNAYLWPQVSALLPLPRQQRIFELGCGNGATAYQMSRLGYEVTGIDASRSGILQGRQAYPGLQLFEASVYDNLVTQYGQFPIVVSLEVIEHLYDPRHYARTMYELLEKNGIGIVSTPYHGYLKNLALAITNKMDRHFTALWDGGHIKFFSPQTLTMLLTEAGFEVINIYRVGRIAPLAKSMIAHFRKP